MRRTIHGQFGAQTAAAMGRVGSPQVTSMIVVISGLTSETISAKGLVRTITGPTEILTDKLRPINLNTGATEGTDSDLGNGSFLFTDLCYEAVVFTKSATSESATIHYRVMEDE